jgi:hypothetical protein
MEAFLKYLEFMPAYVIDLVAVLTSPKTFLKTRNRGDENWPTALRFFGFSAILGFILLQFATTPSPLLPKDTVLINIAKAIVLWGVYILFGAAAIKVSWKLVGGKASFDSILLTHIYCLSMFILIALVLTLIGNGLIKIISPDIYDAAVKMDKTGISKSIFELFTDGNIQQQPSKGVEGAKIVILSAIISITSLGNCIWVIATWGAYRDLNNASRARSFVAFIISCVLFVLVSGMLLVLLPPASSGTS